jgi:hypothetical protein
MSKGGIATLQQDLSASSFRSERLDVSSSTRLKVEDKSSRSGEFKFKIENVMHVRNLIAVQPRPIASQGDAIWASKWSIPWSCVLPEPGVRRRPLTTDRSGQWRFSRHFFGPHRKDRLHAPEDPPGFRYRS